MDTAADDLSVNRALVAGPAHPAEPAIPENRALTDEELTALALAADPATPLSDDAVPVDLYLSQFPSPLPGSLPAWYMPAVRARNHPWWRPIVLVLIIGFLVVDAFGLCATYGQLVVA